MSRNRGQLFEIVDGVNKGRKCIAYYVDQTKELQKANKVCIVILNQKYMAERKTIIEPTFLKRVGFVD